ncbi:GlcG/HbpS family heme-binding protein [Peristeroidobacter soli]|uniref:GlcG/HbpS family heme-binding protein n=1 Tax=Peristeroidobacter soli TaxID=2497877 RepID=UPI00101BCF70|nr:heme-binding protein [Peristeroidobacter soli]
MSISLELANRIIAESFKKGAALGLKPLTVAVLDSGGHLISLQRQDASSNARPQIAIGKAAGALALGVSSRKIAEMALERPAFIAAVGPLAAGGLIPAAGGIIVASADGKVLGAVGVTGDLSDNDELCALAGIEGAGLKKRE